VVPILQEISHIPETGGVSYPRIYMRPLISRRYQEISHIHPLISLGKELSPEAEVSSMFLRVKYSPSEG